MFLRSHYSSQRGQKHVIAKRPNAKRDTANVFFKEKNVQQNVCAKAAQTVSTRVSNILLGGSHKDKVSKSYLEHKELI
jgi:hypothetical protein